MKINNRMYKIGDYEFKALGDLKEKFIREGKEIIDLSIGDPDLEIQENILKALTENAYKIGSNKYPPYEGIEKLKNQIIKYYKEVYSVDLKKDEVLVLIGSKEGISKIIPAVCDIGDYMIVPDPAYPVYINNAYLWGAVPYTLPLNEEDGYIPNLDNIPEKIMSKSKLFLINYPNNPTGASANEDFYKNIINMCYSNNIVLCNDNAYGEIIQSGKKPLSLLSFDYKKQCVEFGTLSKTYNMTGFRIGYVVGNATVLKEILKVKTITDSGQYVPVQEAAVEALKLDREYINKTRDIYDIRRRIAKGILDKYKIKYFDSESTFYLWCKTPKGFTTDEYCKELIYKCGLIVTPGYTFGRLGYNYFRIALTKEADIIKKVLENLKNIK
ncbi:aminotransferase class I/II-fold pyridoxal phosphate-dependent enzyme [Haloimpatiens sp. FM7315]|uniref:aminotransferase class I/II-fold pyridoxal phosphate-dependent enzyme n=1 Tax=Haloimpatiens sp. FM7315 TaxID=3298609 RepID=UPI0035A39595